jgi:hypothetical protein
MLKLSYWEFDTSMINVLRAVKDKIDNIHQQMIDVKIEVEILRKNKEEMTEIKVCNGNEECFGWAH